MRVLLWAAVVWLAGGCGAKSGLLFGAPEADGDADADSDSDADTDADTDADADADGFPCGEEFFCSDREYCCSLDRCAVVGTCCTERDCAEGLACVGGGCAVGDLGCGLDELEIEPVPPNLVILLDRSGSMAAPIDGRRKWDIAVDALRAVLPGYDTEVRFGLMMFPGPQAECTAGVLDVDVGDQTTDAILDVLASSGPLLTTPIGASLNVLREYEGLADPDRRNLVLLVSDGEESCGGEPVSETQRMHDQAPPVAVYVVGFGSEVDDATLAAIADAARTERAADPPYYTAENGAELSDALGAIVASVVPCGFALSAEPPRPDELWVFFDDATPVPRDRSHLDGWDHDPGSNVLTFYGPACDTVKTDSHRVRVVFGCDR